MISLSSLRQKMANYGVGAIFVDDPINISYIAGVSVSAGDVIITEQKAFFLLDFRYNYVKELLSNEWTVFFANTKEDRETILSKLVGLVASSIGFDGLKMRYAKYKQLMSLDLFANRWIDVSDFFSIIRRPKTGEEITKLQQVHALCEEGMIFLYNSIAEGISERELARELEIFFLKKGADGLAFTPIIAFNEHTACPHWKSSTTKLMKNSVVLLDIGVRCDGYHSDMTRVVFFGKVHPQLVQYAQYVQKAAQMAYAKALPGVTPLELDTMVREYFATLGVENLFIHSLGHGVGLEIHEPPRMNQNAQKEAPFMQGDVIAIEPGLYVESLGGIRLENTGYITGEGFVPFSLLPLEPLQV